MIRIGLFGVNGHQLPLQLPETVRAKVVAVAAYPTSRLDETLGVDTTQRKEIREYATLPELLTDKEVDLVSLCSPMRSEQAEHAVMCLDAGKHVYAEKPAAFSDMELDRILSAAGRACRVFREMGGSMLELPIQAIRRLVEQGTLGTIVHVQVHKSYPWHESRPQDFAVDGGLIRQVGIHATRFVIGATGLKIATVVGNATNLGNPGHGKIHIAATFSMTLENGGVASMNLNYLNPTNFGSWGNEQIRVFGTKGMAESVDGFRRHALYLPGRDSTELPMPEHPDSTDYLEHYVNHLLDGRHMPNSYQEEIAALRAINAAHEASVTGTCVVVRNEQQG
ncbi:MAG: Gfo/Idh/MocA family protein [Armatimonadota bacterium]